MYGQLRSFFASAGHRCPEHVSNRDAHERGRHIWPVVDVFLQRAAVVAAFADQSDRVDFKQQSGGASRVSRLGVKDMSLAER